MAAISPPTALFFLWRHSIRPDERLAETNNEPGEPRQVPRKLGSTDADGKGQLGSPTAANDEKTQNRRTSRVIGLITTRLGYTL